MKTIDMQDMRHLNLFSKITRVDTRFCFTYNGMIFFCVPKVLVPKAVGENGSNVRKINEIIGKRVRIIPSPFGIQDARRFMMDIINPVSFKSLDIAGNEMVIVPGSMQNKAAIMGRHKRRLLELEKIVKDYFGKELRIA
jgi:N utilization substance protein A